MDLSKKNVHQGETNSELNVKGGTLIINNSQKLSLDIWQTEADFTESDWKDAVKSFSENLQDIYHWLENNDAFDMPDKLYILGDVINMLKSIDIKKK